MVTYVVKDNQMNEWEKICKAFAEKVGAKLLFVNETSCGIEYSNGAFAHIYVDEMENCLKRY